MLTRTANPTERCVSVAFAKSHLRVDQDVENELIALYLDAAIEDCAKEAGRAFDQQTYRLTASAWPGCGYIPIPIAPIVSVATVKYADVDGNEQTLPAEAWYFDPRPEGGAIVLTSSFLSPTLYGRFGDVRIDFEAGYDVDDGSSAMLPELTLPAVAKAAILLTVGHYYANRESVIVGKTATELPAGARRLLSRIRIYR